MIVYAGSARRQTRTNCVKFLYFPDPPGNAFAPENTCFLPRKRIERALWCKVYHLRSLRIVGGDSPLNDHIRNNERVDHYASGSFFESNAAAVGRRISGFFREFRTAKSGGSAVQSAQMQRSSAASLCERTGAVGAYGLLLRSGKQTRSAPIPRSRRILFTGSQCHGAGTAVGSAARRKDL